MAKMVKCYVCKHPKRREIDKALKAGVSQSEVQRTLCPEVKKHSVQRHFAQDHHLQEPGADWTPTILTKGTLRTKSTIQAKRSKGTRETGGAVVKVHWELPRSLVKKLKHQAVDREIPTIELVREILNGGA